MDLVGVEVDEDSQAGMEVETGGLIVDLFCIPFFYRRPIRI